jgi:hypothetical protein
LQPVCAHARGNGARKGTGDRRPRDEAERLVSTTPKVRGTRRLPIARTGRRLPDLAP